MKTLKMLSDLELDKLGVQGGDLGVGVFQGRELIKTLPDAAADHMPRAAVGSSPALQYIFSSGGVGGGTGVL